MSDVKTGRTVPVPRHLRSDAYSGAKELGNATEYKYAHNTGAPAPQTPSIVSPEPTS